MKLNTIHFSGFCLKGVVASLALLLLVNQSRSQGSIDTELSARAIVTWADAGAPRGRFLLVRKGGRHCAVRFTDYRKGGDAKVPSFFDSGEETLYAEYDWFYLGSASKVVTAQDAETGHASLAKKSLIGVGRLAFRRGETTVKCGPLKLAWLYPTRIDLSDDAKAVVYGIELAPTKWGDIKNVDFADPKLNWYRVDPNRKITYVSLKDLPGE